MQAPPHRCLDNNIEDQEKLHIADSPAVSSIIGSPFLPDTSTSTVGRGAHGVYSGYSADKLHRMRAHHFPSSPQNTSHASYSLGRVSLLNSSAAPTQHPLGHARHPDHRRRESANEYDTTAENPLLQPEETAAHELEEAIQTLKYRHATELGTLLLQKVVVACFFLPACAGVGAIENLDLNGCAGAAATLCKGVFKHAAEFAARAAALGVSPTPEASVHNGTGTGAGNTARSIPRQPSSDVRTPSPVSRVHPQLGASHQSNGFSGEY